MDNKDNNHKKPNKNTETNKKNKKISRSILEFVIFVVLFFLIWTHVNVVVSNSMYPIMERGDFVLVENAGFEFDLNNVKTGDVVIYDAHWVPELGNYPNQLIVYENYKYGIYPDNGNIRPVIHRIIGNYTDKNGNIYYIIKGDNNQDRDPELVKPEQIKKRALSWNDNLFVIPKVGYLSIFVKENVLLVIFIIGLLFIYEYRKSIFKMFNK
ncbi:signal peptidase [Methanococcus voltae]|uniref:Signal peptidase n=1 Tax=Methanococcus voltae TaxID=2188 RepID=A0A8J7RE80_METVO|nr:S26 family signal peptidase [Methanococcus voltae]MBP2201632.1 signal peptidase [Methanococcus voltae]